MVCHGHERLRCRRRYPSAEVEERLAAGTPRLRPQDWKSGDRLWVVEVIAPFGGADEMVKDLKAKVFAAREMNYLVLKEGKKACSVCPLWTSSISRLDTMSRFKKLAFNMKLHAVLKVISPTMATLALLFLTFGAMYIGA